MHVTQQEQVNPQRWQHGLALVAALLLEPTWGSAHHWLDTSTLISRSPTGCTHQYTTLLITTHKLMHQQQLLRSNAGGTSSNEQLGRCNHPIAQNCYTACLPCHAGLVCFARRVHKRVTSASTTGTLLHLESQLKEASRRHADALLHAGCLPWHGHACMHNW